MCSVTDVTSLSGEIQALHSFFAPPPNQCEVLLRLRGVLLTSEARPALRMTLIVVVPGSALTLKSRVKHRPAPDLRDPFRFGLCARLDRTGLMLFCVLDDDR